MFLSYVNNMQTNETTHEIDITWTAKRHNLEKWVRRRSGKRIRLYLVIISIVFVIACAMLYIYTHME